MRLPLLSSGVGVYYCEVSGDLNHGLARETFPALEGAWQASDAAGRLVLFGERELARAASGEAPDVVDGSVGDDASVLVEELRVALARLGGPPGLSGHADAVLQSAWSVVDVISVLDTAGPALRRLRWRAEELRHGLDLGTFAPSDHDVVSLLDDALSAPDAETLDRHWTDYSALVSSGVASHGVRTLAEGDDGVFAVRQSWFSTVDVVDAVSEDFGVAADVVLARADELVAEVSGRSTVALEGSLASFDQGRVLLFAISAVSVLVATLASWLWVGDMVVRRLSRLPVRMRSMASGDLDTPVPEIGPVSG